MPEMFQMLTPDNCLWRLGNSLCPPVTMAAPMTQQIPSCFSFLTNLPCKWMLPKIDTCGPAEQDPKVRNGLTQMHLPDISQRYQGRQRERRKSPEAWGEDEGGGMLSLHGCK